MSQGTQDLSSLEESISVTNDETDAHSVPVSATIPSECQRTSASPHGMPYLTDTADLRYPYFPANPQSYTTHSLITDDPYAEYNASDTLSQILTDDHAQGYENQSSYADLLSLSNLPNIPGGASTFTSTTEGYFDRTIDPQDSDLFPPNGNGFIPGQVPLSLVIPPGVPAGARLRILSSTIDDSISPTIDPRDLFPLNGNEFSRAVTSPNTLGGAHLPTPTSTISDSSSPTTNNLYGNASDDPLSFVTLYNPKRLCPPTPSSTASFSFHSASTAGLPVISLEPAEDGVKPVGSVGIQHASGKRRKKEGIYLCPYRNVGPGCSATFTALHNWRFHIDSHNGVKRHKCSTCPYAATSPATLKRHQTKCKGTGHSANGNA